MSRWCAIALAAGLAAGLTGSGCNLLIGDYTIRDGQSVVIPDAGAEDAVASDRVAGDRSHLDQPTPGKSSAGASDAGEPDAGPT